MTKKVLLAALVLFAGAEAYAGCSHFQDSVMDGEAIEAQERIDRANRYYYSLELAVFFSQYENSCRFNGYDEYWITDRAAVFECSGWVFQHELFFSNLRTVTFKGKDYLLASISEVKPLSESPTGACVYVDLSEKSDLENLVKSHSSSATGSTFERLHHRRSKAAKKIRGCYKLTGIQENVEKAFDTKCLIESAKEI